VFLNWIGSVSRKSQSINRGGYGCGGSSHSFPPAFRCGLVNQVGEYIISSGGKRLRPALVILSAQAFGYQGKQHYDLAAVVEFIHTATLLHDDVVDESELRRGRETANSMFGNAASVLVGDFLYSRAFQMMVEADDMRVMQTLADATNVIAEGEVLQLLNCNNADVDAANYLDVIHRKTAKLFEAAMRLGAILGKQMPGKRSCGCALWHALGHGLSTGR
jgi:octaprenyl-diphosphate synthase